MAWPAARIRNDATPAETVRCARQSGAAFDEAAYGKCLQDSIATVVREQVETGVDVGTAGTIHWLHLVSVDGARELRLGYAGTGIFHAKNGTGALSIKLEIDATAIRIC